MPQDDSPRAVPIPATDSFLLALLLFLFWVVLSGKFDLFHLGVGAIASFGVALLSNGLYALEPSIGPSGRNPFARFPWIRMARYAPWLLSQICLSSVQVAKVVLAPRMDLRPKMFRFTHPLPHGLARTTLANSITLTPGTVTIDLVGDEYLVHALIADYTSDLEGNAPDSMKERVARVFERSTS
jgi:multicomponent Na+:H+ antiporter subunit E